MEFSVLNEVLSQYSTNIGAGFAFLRGDVSFLLHFCILLTVFIYSLDRMMGRDLWGGEPTFRNIMIIVSTIFLTEQWEGISTLIGRSFIQIAGNSGSQNIPIDDNLLLPPSIITQQSWDTFQQFVYALRGVAQGLDGAGEKMFIMIAHLVIIMVIFIFIAIMYMTLISYVIMTVIEFKIVSLLGYIFIPFYALSSQNTSFGTFNQTVQYGEHAVAHVIRSGAKLMMLTFTIKINFMVIENLDIDFSNVLDISNPDLQFIMYLWSIILQGSMLLAVVFGMTILTLYANQLVQSLFDGTPNIGWGTADALRARSNVARSASSTFFRKNAMMVQDLVRR